MTRLLTVASMAAVLCSSGCDDTPSDQPELGQVHGVVTMDDLPLSGVSVYFKPDVGRQSIAKADQLGNYTAMYKLDEPGVKIGPNTVTVEWGTGESGPAIPPEYGAKSTLKLDVKAGDNEFNIDMKSPEDAKSKGK